MNVGRMRRYLRRTTPKPRSTPPPMRCACREGSVPGGCAEMRLPGSRFCMYCRDVCHGDVPSMEWFSQQGWNK